MTESAYFSFENICYRLNFSAENLTYSVSFSEPDGGFHNVAENVTFGAKVLLGAQEVFLEPHALEKSEEIEKENAAGKFKEVLLTFMPPTEANIKLHLTFELYYEQPFFITHMAVENLSGETLTVLELSPFVLSPARDGVFHLGSRNELRFLKNGWQSWSPSLSLSLAEKDVVQRTRVFRRVHQYDENYKPRKKGEFVSEAVTAIKNMDTQNVFVLGFVTFKKHFAQIFLRAQNESSVHVSAVSNTEGTLLEPGAKLSSEKLFVHFSPHDESAALSLFAETLQKLNDVKITKEMPTGWCTWYYYFRNINEEEVLKNLVRLKSLKDDVPVKLFQIDDGYQKAVGDWLETNKKFPSGMKACAAQIKEAGFMPGIWLAPFVVTCGSSIWREHPDWILKDERGKKVIAGLNPLWEGWVYYSLDTSHPEALEWLKHLFHTVCKEWGYAFIKIDFIFGAAVKGVHYNKNVTRCEAYRMGLQAVRDGAGDDAFILGCGAPLFPSIGIVDGMRIGMDVDPSWIHFSGKIVGGYFTLGTRNALMNTLTRSFMHRRFWHNDPDCLLVRDTKTKLTQSEVEMLAVCISLSGGMLLTSDNLLELSPERLELLAKMFPALHGSGKTLGLCDEALPPGIVFHVNEDVVLLSAFAWDENPSAREFSLKEFGVEGVYLGINLLENRYLGFVRENVSSVFTSRGAKLYLLRKYKGNPCVLWTDAHITGGAHFIKEEYYSKDLQQLHFVLDAGKPFNGKIFVYVPGLMKLKHAQSSAQCSANPHPPHEELIELLCNFKETADFVLTFE